MKITMFAPIVRDRDSGEFDIRALELTLESAKYALNRTVPPGTLAWDNEFGGAISNRYSKLIYEVRPVQVNITTTLMTQLNRAAEVANTPRT